MITPIFMNHSPHSPTISANTAAAEGGANTANSPCDNNPNGNIEIAVYDNQHSKNPIKVALLTAFWLSALSEITTAPSIPINDHKVTNIVLFICPPIPPRFVS